MQMRGIGQKVWSGGLPYWRWFLAGGLAMVLAFGLWGFATRVQGAEQRAPAYQGAG
ncbi:MAG: hypothetical protein M1370_06170 [Bacteroidetes bacterium]|nr:hypothetical protein [Bacteroidota bacterium]